MSFSCIFYRWCKICKDWKRELLLERKNPKADWKHTNNTKSWEWPSNEDSIIEVFLPKSWAGILKTNIDDISTAVNIWTNCN